MLAINTPDALRAIGQDLDLRGLKTFSIRCDSHLVVVEAGYQPPPAAMPVTIHYCAKDVEELNRKAQESSDYLSATRSFIYMSEMLAAIGTYVETKEGRLVSVSNTASSEAAPVIDIEYDTARGDRIFQRLSGGDVYALSVRKHKRKQQSQARNELRFSRFSSMPECARPQRNKNTAA